MGGGVAYIQYVFFTKLKTPSLPLVPLLPLRGNSHKYSRFRQAFKLGRGVTCRTSKRSRNQQAGQQPHPCRQHLSSRAGLPSTSELWCRERAVGQALLNVNQQIMQTCGPKKPISESARASTKSHGYGIKLAPRRNAHTAGQISSGRQVREDAAARGRSRR